MADKVAVCPECLQPVGPDWHGPKMVELDEVNRGPEPKAKASKQELVEALIEVRDRCGRVAEARAVARRVLGK